MRVLMEKFQSCRITQVLTTGRGKIGHWDVVVSLLHVQRSPKRYEEGRGPQVVGITNSQTESCPSTRLSSTTHYLKPLPRSPRRGMAEQLILQLILMRKISQTIMGSARKIHVPTLWKNQTRGGRWSSQRMFRLKWFVSRTLKDILGEDFGNSTFL